MKSLLFIDNVKSCIYVHKLCRMVFMEIIISYYYGKLMMHNHDVVAHINTTLDPNKTRVQNPYETHVRKMWFYVGTHIPT